MLAKTPQVSPLIAAAGIGVFRAGRWQNRHVDVSLSPRVIGT